MKRFLRRYFVQSIILLGIILTLSLIYWPCSSGTLQPRLAQAKISPETPSFDQVPSILNSSDPRVQAAIAAQNRHNPHLLDFPDVVGTAVGLDEADNLAILVFTKKVLPTGLIPKILDGIPVAMQVTGEIFAMIKPSGRGKIDLTQSFDRPVPIGVSTGNEGECSAGTIGARVLKEGQVYALSNNHVYALENRALVGSQILQPGRYDTNCSFSFYNVIGTLDDYQPVSFSTTNTIDAAIALSSITKLDKATPANGYGLPKSTTMEAPLGQTVQKYGRTTALTKGSVQGINATIMVLYETGTATFVNQIVVSGTRPFIKAGDSGSLLVTDPGKNPVGLLFAGDTSGKLAFANPIGPVLERFQVIIDGEIEP